jgi:hypothetical protein
MDNEEYEEKWFWETDEIYDYEGDLLIWSLMGVAVCSLQTSILIASDFIKSLQRELIL